MLVLREKCAPGGRTAARRTVTARRGGNGPLPLISRLTLSGFSDLQTLAGNRAMARTVATLQRRSAQELIDKRISLAWPSPDVVDDELVPVGEAPGRFEGFSTSTAALTVARRSPEVCMVLRDADGRYHVLRTTARSLGDKYAAPEDPAGWKIIEIVEPTKRATDDEFRREYETARDAPAAAQAEAYRRLLVVGTHLDYDETAWSPDKARMFPGKVNVALWLPSRGRHEPAEVVPTGSAELPATTILIGNTPFADGPDSLRSTLLHESRHAYHMAETLDLIRKWRQTRKVDSLPAWQLWLKSRRKSVPAEVFQTTWAATDPDYGTATTETYSHLYQFMYRFRRDEAASTDPADLDKSATTLLYGRMLTLTVLGEYWEAAGQDAQEFAMDMLVRFLQGLTASHRQHVLNFMKTSGQVAAGAPKVFYAGLTKRL